MANYAVLKSSIENDIKQNGQNAITGVLLQQALLSMINSLGADYQFAGVATPETNPGTPDQNVFYFGLQQGIYPNFNSTVVGVGQFAVFSYNGTWTCQTTTLLELVDNLTTNDATKGLTAKQGYILNRLLGTGYQFMGLATPSTNPGTPETKVFYIGGSGSYENFGASHEEPFVVNEGSIGIFSWNEVWSRETLLIVNVVDIDTVPTQNSNSLITSGAVYKSQLEQDVIIGVHNEDFKVSSGRVAKYMYFSYSGRVHLKLSLISGTDPGQYRIYSQTGGSVGTALCALTNFGTAVDIEIPAGCDGIYVLTSDNTLSAERTYRLEMSLLDSLIGLSDKVQTISDRTSAIDGDIINFSTNATRIQRYFHLNFPRKRVTININASLSGTYSVYGANDAMTSYTELIVPATNLGTPSSFEVPANGNIYVITSLLSSATDITLKIDLDDSVVANADKMEKIILPYLTNVWDLSSGRLSKYVYVGAQKMIRARLLLESGTDAGQWRIYATTGEGAGFGDVISELTNFGEDTIISVPSSGWFIVFSTLNISANRTYKFEVFASGDLGSDMYITDALKDKTVVCFGDSLTEFSEIIGGRNVDGMRYSDFMQFLSGAKKIYNVGIGGTQLRQRTARTLTPTTSELCYAALDIVNMVDAAMNASYDYVDAAVSKLIDLNVKDLTSVANELKSIEWQKVNYVTVFAGTNDWANNGGNTGEINSSDKNYTLGAVNEIIRMLLSTYPHIHIFWFTPIIRCVDADYFSASVQYNIGDYCTYSRKYYRFVAAHQGAWNANDVIEVARSAFRIPIYFSDNAQKNGKTLREFSGLIYDCVKKNHIPVCDFYNSLGWNLYNMVTYFPDNDNTHPRYGFGDIAVKMVQFINSPFN